MESAKEVTVSSTSGKPLAGKKSVEKNVTDGTAETQEEFIKTRECWKAGLTAVLEASRNGNVLKTPDDLRPRTRQDSKPAPLSCMDDKMTSRCHELSLQINDMKSKLGMPPYQEIAIFARKVFSSMPVVNSVSCKMIPSGIILIIVRKEKSMANVLDQIYDGTAKLEAFPDTYFERWILSTTEVQKNLLWDSTLIY